MFGVIATLLNAAFGLLVNKVRVDTAKKLKEGDLTDEKCRQLIVTELDDIKSKLDGLARKDLLSSISFFKEGIRCLNLSVDTDSFNNKSDFVQDKPEEGSQAKGACGGRAVFGEALPLKLAQAIRRLKIASEERFSSAMASFKDSRREATRAFNNEALSSEDRILATKLRMASKILESLEDPEAAVNDCKLYLEELHAMPAIREIFSVYLSGGMKSLFNKTQRLENVTSVTLLNFALCDFIKRFSKAPLGLLDWPKIELGKESYHPICRESEIVLDMKEAGLETPCQLTCNVAKTGYRYCSAVNSNREIIIESKITGTLNVINGKGEIKLFCSLPQEDTEASYFSIRSVAIDNEDNAYIVTEFERTRRVYNYKLFVFDAKGNFRHQFPLPFLISRGFFRLCIVITNDKKIVIVKKGDGHVYVCNDIGQLQYSFPLKKIVVVDLSISEKSGIVLASRSENIVYIYTEEGKLRQKIELPIDYKVLGVAFNYITKQVIVYASLTYGIIYYLLSYSETGELQSLPVLHDADDSDKLTSCPNGPVALVHSNGVLFV